MRLLTRTAVSALIAFSALFGTSVARAETTVTTGAEATSPTFLAEAVREALKNADEEAVSTATPSSEQKPPAADADTPRGILGALTDLALHLWKFVASLFSSFVKIRFYRD